MSASRPPRWLRIARSLRRGALDVLSGDYFAIARPSPERRRLGATLAKRFVETQEIRQSDLWSNKVHNLKLAGSRIEDMAVRPREILSFWALVGEPRESEGFLPGRSILDGEPRASSGGGLCQLSWIVYALALRAGLKIRERHAHSVDLYDVTTRFAPLGSDATVVHGSKDLRVRNTLPFPICFRFVIGNDSIAAHFCSLEPIPESAVEHRIISADDDVVVVETVCSNADASVRYRRLSRYRKARPSPRLSE